jgi:CRP-like cAMP-binding protein
MFELVPVTAFVMGIISACSLPLGTITSAFWRPGDRAVAFLMAFGGGALLAALTIDLVGSALEQGHFYALAVGCIVGGMLFVALNEIVNDYGGFLRKASTTIYHIRRQDHLRFKRILSNVGRIDIFAELPEHEFKALAASIYVRDFRKGATVYRRQDPPDALYVIIDGSVQLLDPAQDMAPFAKLGKKDAFGRMAFLTGAPYATVALAAEDTTLCVLPRPAFNALLANSPTLLQVMHRWLRSPEVLCYLQERHGIGRADAERWSDAAVKSLMSRGTIPPLLDAGRRDKEFLEILDQIDRLPVFQNLPSDEAKTLSSRAIFKHHKRGESFFHKGDHADRMYVIESGEVSLIDRGGRGRRPTILKSRAAFGGMSFLTGARHSVTAIATEDTAVWVLLKSDLGEILKKAPELEHRVRTFLQRGEVSVYLERKQHFDPDKAARWIQKAIKSIDAGQLIPAASDTAAEMHEHSGAPLAIWLGIMLDGIPESLVIGASLIHSHISLSLLAGLFLSNYPEALSSSVGMRQQGLSFNRILFMWTSLMVITGIGAALGSMFFVGAEPFMFATVEGIAAGAMLTMIAQTMLPEAYFKGGSIIGFSTLLGFLAAIFFKTLE